MPDLLAKKIALIQDYLKRLEEFLRRCAGGRRPDDATILSIERLFQLMIDEAVDVNAMILESEKQPTPETNQATFQALADRGILPRALHAKIAGSVGLRNRLVHRYETVHRRVLLKETPRYAAAYKEYLAILIKKFL